MLHCKVDKRVRDFVAFVCQGHACKCGKVLRESSAKQKRIVAYHARRRVRIRVRVIIIRACYILLRADDPLRADDLLECVFCEFRRVGGDRNRGRSG